ncbi:hypothetical protein [Serratia proteamaculans]|uniref:hypothetical protein n=1 Tax=Serratia proteamaculans TaxID=28151 RepID=UPI0039AEAB33
MNARNIGKMGENAITYWCSQQNITATFPSEDRHGWDLLLEFPKETHNVLSGDQHPPAIECKVQVKSTDNKTNTWAIKLSNLEMMVKSPLPSFLLFLHFEKSTSVKNAFLVHIDELITAKTLERLRRLSIVDSKHDFHNHTITIKYGNEHELTTLDGSGLKKKIESYIVNYSNYATRKIKQNNEIGYDPINSHGFTLELTEKEHKEELINLFLGEINEVKNFKMSIFNNRFGIKEITENFEFGTCRLSLPEPYKKEEISEISIIPNDNKPNTQAIPCTIIFPPPLVSVNSELFKFKIETKFFNIIMAPNSGTFNIKQIVNENEKHQINELYDGLKALETMIFKQKNFSIKLKTKDVEPIFYHSGKVKSKKGTETKNITIETLDNLIKLCNDFRINHKVKISINELDHLTNPIKEFSMINANSDAAIKATFEFDKTSNIPINKNLVGIGRTGFVFGGYFIYKIFSTSGVVSKIKNSGTFLARGIKIESTEILSCAENDHVIKMNEHIDDVIKNYAKIGDECLLLYPE